MKKSLINVSMISVATAVVLSMTGCGGGGSGSSTSATQTGTFVDAPVQGLYYKTATQSGYTNSQGQFHYKPGETVTFKLGTTLVLGSAKAGAFITPYTISHDNNNTAINIAMVLQNFDGNRSNTKVLNLSKFKNANLTADDINITAPNITVQKKINDLLSTSSFQKYIDDANRTLIPATQAKTNMNNYININKYDLKKLFVGKTYYIAINSDPHHVETLQFKSNGHIIDTYINHGKHITNNTITYSITNEVLFITGKGDDGKPINATLTPPFKKMGTYIEAAKNTGNSTDASKLYLTKQAAEKALTTSTTSGNSGYSEKVSDLISGHINFIDENGSSISTPTNAWIRITPKENQIDGNWNGVNCKLDANGNFGAECYVHTNVESMRKYFNRDYSNTYQFISYIDEKTGDTRFEKEEKSFGELNTTDGADPFTMHYGDWKNATVIVNNS